MREVLPSHRLLRNAILAALIAAAQLALALGAAGPKGLGLRWSSLFQWDSEWYESIVVRGYVSRIPPTYRDKEHSNVAFFPAYPIAARLLVQVTHVQPRAALLVVSQICAGVFWLLFLQIGEQLGLSAWQRGLGVAVVFAFPTSFYLMTAYSESLFLASLCGFLYFGVRCESALGAAGYVLSGALMTAGRIVGMPVALVHLVQRRRPKDLLLALGCMMGGASFLAYCQWHFGAWNLYQQSQAVSWDVHPMLSALFRWNTWGLFWLEQRTYAEKLPVVTSSKLLTAFFSWVLAAIVVLHFWGRRTLAESLARNTTPLLLAALCLHAMAVTGLYSRNFVSMNRYMLSEHVLVVLWGLAWAREWRILRTAAGGKALACRALVVVLALLPSLVVQCLFIRRFTLAGWVA